MLAQQARGDINGVLNTWYCGAYWYNGFHEDGVHSALDVVDGISQLAVGGKQEIAEVSVAYQAEEQKYE